VVYGHSGASSLLQASRKGVDQTAVSVEKQPWHAYSLLSRTAFIVVLCFLAACGSKQSTAKPASTPCASVSECLRLVEPMEPHIKVMAPSAAGLVFESGVVAATNTAQPFLTISYREPTRRLRLRLAVFDHVTTACPPNRVERSVTSPAGRAVCLSIFPKDVDARYGSDGLVYVLSATPYPAPTSPKWSATSLQSRMLRIVDSYR